MHAYTKSAWSRLARLVAGLLFVLINLSQATGAELGQPQALSPADAHDYGVRLNGELLEARTLFVRDRAGRTFVARDVLSDWNITPAGRCTASLQGKTFCSLDDINAIHIAFNSGTHEYTIDVAPQTLQKTSLDLPWREELATPAARNRAAFLNYDFHASSGGLLTNGPTHGYSSLFAGGLTGPGGTLTTNFLVQSGIPSHPKIALLDTTWQHDDIPRHTTLLVGDSVTSGGTFGAELRYFGIGWTSNFDSDPSFVTSPTVTLGGISSVPSVVDLYLNNALTYSKDVPAGPFELNNLPTVNGQGEVKLVVRDLLGRQQVVTGSYYGTPSILRRGLNDFAIEGGFERQNYGVRSLQYGPLFFEGNVRRGLTNRFTAELHGELEATAQEAGLIGNWLVPKLGVFNLGVAANRGSFGKGAAALAGYDLQGQHWNVGTSVQLRSPQFWQLGSSASDLGASRSANVHVGVRNERGDSVGLAYVEQTYFDSGANKVLSFTIDRQLRHGDIEIDALHTSGFNGGLGVQVFYHVSLGKRRSLNVETDRGPTTRDDKVELSLGRSPGAFGYASRLQLDSGDTNALSAQVTHYGPTGTQIITASAASNALAFEADLAGGIASVDHRRYFTSRLLDAFAVVHVGYPRVRVYEDGQLRGVTDRSGNLAVPNLSAYDSTTLSIEPKDLPAGVAAVSDSRTIVPTLHAAASVWFATQRTGDVSVTVVTPQGKPLAAGTLLHARGLAAQWAIRANGTALISAVPPGLLRLTATNASLECRFTVMIPTKLEPTPSLAPVRCLPDAPPVRAATDVKF